MEKRQKFPIDLPLVGVLPAGIVGLGIMALHGSSRTMLVMNLGALVLGFVSGPCLSNVVLLGSKRRPHISAAVILILLGLTFVDAGLDGVHRWLRFGPLRLHPSALGLPLLLLVLTFFLEQRASLKALVILALAMCLHIAQPDAGQATALAAATVVFATFRDQPLWSRLAFLGVGILGSAAAWLRPDPLHGVPMVEDIVPQAFAMHAGLGIAAMLALVVLPASALFYTRSFASTHLARVYGLALGAYFLGSVVVVGVGEFPTPVLGFGASPILGAIWGLTLLSRVIQESKSA